MDMWLVQPAVDVAARVASAPPILVDRSNGWFVIKIDETAAMYVVIAVVFVMLINRIVQSALDWVVQMGLTSLWSWVRGSGNPNNAGASNGASHDLDGIPSPPPVPETETRPPTPVAPPRPPPTCGTWMTDDVSMDLNHEDLPIVRLSVSARQNAFHCWSSCGDVRGHMQTFRMCQKCFVKCIKAKRSMYGGEKYMGTTR